MFNSELYDPIYGLYFTITYLSYGHFSFQQMLFLEINVCTFRVMSSNISKVEKLASGSKLNRMLNNPVKYALAISSRELLYKLTKKSIIRKAPTFFGTTMEVMLPASVDIYLTGGKTHDSEIRLAKYMINHISAGDTFIDIGAHYGYFALLAHSLIGNKDGNVLAIEASPTTKEALMNNTNSTKADNIKGLNIVMSDEDGEVTFYEFPNLYSEYNSLDITQYEDENWFQNNQPQEVKMQSRSLDSLVQEYQLQPDYIKIDVEGAEYQVLSGAKNLLSTQSPTLILEFLNDGRSDSAHYKSAALLGEYEYRPYKIDSGGELSPIDDITSYMNDKDSDNIVFQKK